MSRHTIYSDERVTLVGGNDHMFGDFLQLYDKDLQHETPEGEGLILDWSQHTGISINYTGQPTSLPVMTIIRNYIEETKQ
jgi:hypothetical protein